MLVLPFWSLTSNQGEAMFKQIIRILAKASVLGCSVFALVVLVTLYRKNWVAIGRDDLIELEIPFVVLATIYCLKSMVDEVIQL